MLRRWAGRHEIVCLLIVYAALTAAAYAPVSILGRSLQPSLYYHFGMTSHGPWGPRGRQPLNLFDVDLGTPAYYEWPINRVVGRMYSAGRAPLWDPFEGAGTPLAAQYSSRAFFPYQVVEDICPVAFEDWFILGRICLAGFLTHLFLRRLRLSLPACFLGGAAYMFSGTMVWFVNLEQMANVAMVLPLLLLALENCASAVGRRGVPCAALVTGLVLLAGQPEVALFALTLGAAYYTLRVIYPFQFETSWIASLATGSGSATRTATVCTESEIRQGSLPWRSSGGAVLRYLAASALGLLIAAPMLLPFHELVSNGVQLHAASAGMGTVSPTPWPMAAAIAAPTLARQPVAEVMFPDNGRWDYLGGYTGALPLFLPFAALFLYGWRRRPELTFFTAAGSVILLKDFGIPPFVWLGHLPLFNQAWSPRWAGPAWTFSFAAAAAFSAELLSDRRRPRRAEPDGGKPRVLASLLVAALASAAILSWHLFDVILDHLFFSKPAPLESLYPHVGDSTLYAPCAAPALLVAAATIAASIAVIRSENRFISGTWALVILTLSDLWFAIPDGYPNLWVYLKLGPWLLGLIAAFACVNRQWKWMQFFLISFLLAGIALDAASPLGLPSRQDPFRPAPYVGFLRSHAGLQRVMAFGGVLYPNFSGALGLYDVRFIVALSVSSYQRFIVGLRSNSHALWFTGQPDSPNHGAEDLSKNFRLYSLLGVRYFVVPHAGRESAQSVTDDTLRALKLRQVYNGEVGIYENPAVLPRAFLVDRVCVSRGMSRTLAMLRSPSFDLRRDAVVESSAPNLALRAGGSPHMTAASKAVISRYTADRVEIRASSARPALLILTDTFYPGWEATVDGVSVPVLRVDGTFRGVVLTPGRHFVSFHYAPRSYVLGLWLAGAAIACILLVCCEFWRDTRRGENNCA